MLNYQADAEPSVYRLQLNKNLRKQLFLLLMRNQTLQQLSHQTGLTLHSLKHWSKGQRTLPSAAIEKIQANFPESKEIFDKGKMLEATFWASKGGKRYAKNLSRKEMFIKMEKMRSSKRHYSAIDFKPDSKNSALEFFGIMMGDGCITEYYSNSDRCNRSAIFISGNANSDLTYLQEHVRKLLSNTFKTNAYLRFRAQSKTIDIVIRNKQLVKWLKLNDFPSGKKGQIKIPDKLEKLQFKKLKYLLRGLFDTDGCLSARKSENYSDPFILISSGSAPLRKQLKTILRKEGFPAYDSSNTVGIKGAKHVVRWFREIGSKNPRNIIRYAYWAKYGQLPLCAAQKGIYSN